VPAVVFRARTTSVAHPVPPIDNIGGEDAVETFAIAGGWRIVGRCG